jgi:signal transduction histidine kinase
MPEGITPSSITKIAHELANALNTISSTVQLLGNNLKDGQDVVGLNPELITILKDECSRMQIHLDELRQLAKQSLA